MPLEITAGEFQRQAFRPLRVWKTPLKTPLLCRNEQKRLQLKG
jgi:hypothetical protein